MFTFEANMTVHGARVGAIAKNKDEARAMVERGEWNEVDYSKVNRREYEITT